MRYQNDHEQNYGIADPIFASVQPLRLRNLQTALTGYTSYERTFGDFDLSLKLVYSNQLNSISDRIGDSNVSHRSKGLFPTLKMVWNFNQDKGNYLLFQIESYNQQSNYNLLNNRVTYISSNLYTTGNKYLRDEKDYRFQAVCSLNGNWYLNTFFNYGNHPWTVMTFESEEVSGLYYTKPVNIGHKATWYASVTHTVNPVKNVWRMQNTAGIRQTHWTYGSNRIDDPFFFIHSNHQFFITDNFGLSLSAGYDSKSRGLGFERRGSFNLGPGFHLSLINNRLNIQGQVGGLFASKSKYTYKNGTYTTTSRRLDSPVSGSLYISWSFTAGKQIRRIQMQRAQGWVESSTTM